MDKSCYLLAVLEAFFWFFLGLSRGFGLSFGCLGLLEIEVLATPPGLEITLAIAAESAEATNELPRSDGAKLGIPPPVGP